MIQAQFFHKPELGPELNGFDFELPDPLEPGLKGATASDCAIISSLDCQSSSICRSSIDCFRSQVIIPFDVPARSLCGQGCPLGRADIACRKARTTIRECRSGRLVPARIVHCLVTHDPQQVLQGGLTPARPYALHATLAFTHWLGSLFCSLAKKNMRMSAAAVIHFWPD
jgi:hypothetical protein